MNCPYCDEDMEEGCVGTREGYGLFFVKQPAKLPSVFDTKSQIEAEGTIILDGPRHTRIKDSYCPAHLCRSCGKIILDCGG
ncbi:PF20097 family protein [Intestinimonas timonensis]|uniref:PF20097 family protein n=1 Tax=Intestinimonas timonensis TaxID=1689270 RepID=UPI003BF83DFE